MMKILTCLSIIVLQLSCDAYAAADGTPSYDLYMRYKIGIETYKLEISGLNRGDNKTFWRTLRISCFDKCKNSIAFEEKEIETPVGVYSDGAEITTLWTAGSANWIKIYYVTEKGINKVLDQPTKDEPIFTRTKSGARAIKLWSGSAGDYVRSLSMSDQEKRKFYDQLTHTWVWNGDTYVEENNDAKQRGQSR